MQTITKNKSLLFFKSFFSLVTFTCMIMAIQFFAANTEVSAAYSPLEITNIKPASSGTPAISPTHRIFRAYPGKEYKIRASVIGGMYPYKFSLSNAPSGMTINSSTGVIDWPNPQASAGPITLTVKDSENTTVSSSWSITVGTSGFLFVDSAYTGVSTGSITQPFKSIQDIINLSNHESDIVYFKGGTYTLPIFQPYYYTLMGCQISYGGGKPHIWLASPGEDVTIDMSQHFFEAASVTATPYYFQGLKFANMANWGFRTSSSMNYFTFYECKIDGMIKNTSGNNNEGFIFTEADGRGWYMTFQNNTFSNGSGISYIGSLYQQSKVLVEDNDFSSLTMGTADYVQAIAFKAATQQSTIRHNTFNIADSSVMPIHGGWFAWLGETSNKIEICFNYIYKSSGGRALSPNQNRIAIDQANQGALWVYRNTIVGGDITMYYLDVESQGGPPLSVQGPYLFKDNVIVNPNAGITYHYSCGPNASQRVTLTNNISRTTAIGLVDSSGFLTGSFAAYVGSIGWQTNSIQKIISGTVCDDSGKCRPITINP